MIHAIGIDIVEVGRIEDIINRWGIAFIQRIYTQEEIDYCACKARTSIHFAARFAAKEAFMKCLGDDLRHGVTMRHIAVVNNRNGIPVLKFHQGLADRLASRGIMTAHISISHTDNYATAMVILEKT
ncbi:MAG TPA: holo-[acyl-carrier-protein] synthase [Deltaproteobacteria bacterium]|nr:holo-[acyl-carrier-protein] synthase [Deltaproteobacteria bacterium]